ncbi:MAG: hypothetical protein JSW05_06500 [Candidatus Thorarchaeota archaeon]|nr:MAG: hypothetical protein JSW05_06500 [Candidatus Thorarchaeota archaeon]
MSFDVIKETLRLFRLLDCPSLIVLPLLPTSSMEEYGTVKEMREEHLVSDEVRAEFLKEIDYWASKFRNERNEFIRQALHDLVSLDEEESPAKQSEKV